MDKDDTIYCAKSVSFYNSTVNAWYETNFQKDKFILTFSAHASVVLLSLAFLSDVSNTLAIAACALGVSSFLACVFVVLCILSSNARYLQSIVHAEDVEKQSDTLGFLDKVAMLSFISGFVFFILFVSAHSYFRVCG